MDGITLVKALAAEIVTQHYMVLCSQDMQLSPATVRLYLGGYPRFSLMPFLRTIFRSMAFRTMSNFLMSFHGFSRTFIDRGGDLSKILGGPVLNTQIL